MKQRVSIIRALANDPEVLLMDEPLGALDAQTRIVLQEELLRIWEETRKTVVYITHSLDEAILLGDRVILMTAHPGRNLATYTVDIPRPRNSDTVNTPAFAELRGEIWQRLAPRWRAPWRCRNERAGRQRSGAAHAEPVGRRRHPRRRPSLAWNAVFFVAGLWWNFWWLGHGRRLRADRDDRRAHRAHGAAAPPHGSTSARWPSASRCWRSSPGSSSSMPASSARCGFRRRRASRRRCGASPPATTSSRTPASSAGRG